MRSVDTYMLVGPNGEITFDFEGHITADGIDLISGNDSSPPTDRQILWHRDTHSGAIVARIKSFYEVFGEGSRRANLELISQSLFSNEPSLAKISASGLSGRRANLTLNQEDFINAQTTSATVSLDTGTKFATLLDASGRSSFLQHAPLAGNPTAKLDQVDYGTASFTWPGGTSLVIFTKAHTLGRQPVMCLATPGQDAVTGGVYLTIINSLTSTLMGFRCQTPSGFAPAAGTVSALHWLVIG